MPSTDINLFESLYASSDLFYKFLTFTGGQLSAVLAGYSDVKMIVRNV